MRALLVLVLLAAGCGPDSYVRGQEPATPEPQRLRIDVTVVQYLETLADTATSEHGRCLIGGWLDDTTPVIDGIAEAPWLTYSADSVSVYYNWPHCPVATMAVWHNHLYLYRRHTPETHCALSETDAALLARSDTPSLLMISVRPGVSCMFWYRDVPGVGAVIRSVNFRRAK